MINDRRVLALIPARGGSKGIKNKNIVELCGQPLISYTIQAAKMSRYIDTVMVSTDSQEIRKISQQYGAEIPFDRPAELATDEAKTIDTVIYTIEKLKELELHYDVLVLLQATSPLRTVDDIDGAIEKYIASNEQDVVGVSKVTDSPILIRTIEENGSLKKLLEMCSSVRRQDMPDYYRVNGSVYVNKIDNLSGKTSFNDNPIPYIIEQSHAIDIDEPLDLEMASVIIKKTNQSR